MIFHKIFVHGKPLLLFELVLDADSKPFRSKTGKIF